MGRGRAFVGVVVVAFVGSACGPNVSTLAREKKFDELVCAPSSEDDLRVAGKALHDELAPAYEIVEVRRSDVASSDPAIDALFAKSVIFGVEVTRRKSLLADYQALVREDDVTPTTFGNLFSMARLTDEWLPEGSVKTGTSVSIDAHEATQAVMTLGLSRFFSNKPAVSTSTTTEVTRPPPDIFKARSPRTFAISEAYEKRKANRNITFYIADRHKPITVGYSLTVHDRTNHCDFSIYHYGAPVSFAQPRASFAWEGWSGLERRVDGESIEVHKPR